MNAGAAILSERTPALLRGRRGSWVVAIPPNAAAFVAVPTGVPERAALSGAAIDQVLTTARAEDRREVVVAGFLVHVHGSAWERPRLVAALRTLLLSRQVGIVARPVASTGLIPRLRAVLMGRQI